MTPLESEFVKLASTIAKRSLGNWMQDQKAKKHARMDLTEIAAEKLKGNFLKRDFERQLEATTDEISRRLNPFVSVELRNLTVKEKFAAVSAVNQVLIDADLSDEALFGADLNAPEFVRGVRASQDVRRARESLNSEAQIFFDLVMSECLDSYIRIVYSLAETPVRIMVENLGRLTQISLRVAAVLDRLPARDIDSAFGDDPDADFRTRYLDYLSARIEKMDSPGLANTFRPTTPVRDVYLNVGLGSEKPAAQRISPDATDVLTPHSDTRVENIVASNRRLLIRGDAGSGKTTMLQWLALGTADQSHQGSLEQLNSLTPFIIYLRQYADSPLPKISEILLHCAPSLAIAAPAAWIHRQFSAGKAFLLVDGIDEIPSARRTAVREWLHEMAIANPLIRIVVTGRPAATPRDWLYIADFAPVRMEPLSLPETKRLIRRWYGAVATMEGLPCPPDKLPAYRNRLLRRLEANPRLRLLASSPLLCTMLCALNIERNGNLPESRVEIYEEALTMLMSRREALRGLVDDPMMQAEAARLDFTSRRSLLKDLAWRLTQRNEAEATIAQVEDWLGKKLALMRYRQGEVLDASVTLKLLLERSGVLQQPDSGSIEFIHRTFLEFLAAHEISEDDKIDSLLSRLSEDGWQELAILTAGVATGRVRSELLEGLIRRTRRRDPEADFLVVRCLETLTEIPSQYSETIDNVLSRVLPPRDLHAAGQIAGAGPVLLPFISEGTLKMPEIQAMATVQLVALIGGDEAAKVLARCARDLRPGVQAQLLSIWSYVDSAVFAETILNPGMLVEGVLHVNSLEEALLGNAKVPDAKFHAHLEADDLPDLAAFPSLTGLSVEGLVRDLSPLTAHKDLTRLELRDTTPIVDYSVISQFHALKELSLTGCRSLVSARYFEKLQYLSLLRIGRCIGPLAFGSNWATTALTLEVPRGQEILHAPQWVEVVRY